MLNDYIKEKELKGNSKAKSIEAIKISLEQVEKSICKIKCNDYESGTGFFLNIINVNEWNSLSLKAIVTNNHILKEDDLLNGKKIKFSLNNKKNYEILIDESRKTYTSEKYDISIIEMKQKDGIAIDSFLEIDSRV